MNGCMPSTKPYCPECINRTGTTIVMATHDAQIVDQVRKRVVELADGIVVRDQARGVYGYAL